MDLTTWLESQGWDRATLTDGQLTSLQAAWRASQNPTPTPTSGGGDTGPTTYDALMSQFRGEQEREREVTALAASALRDHPEQNEKIDQIVKLAFAGKWSTKDTELALLRGLRQQAPSPLSRGGREVSAQTVEAALAMAAGLPEGTALKSYGERTLETAHAAFKGGLSLGELIVGCARRNGYADASIRGNTLETLRAALRVGTPMSVGFSNVSLPGIFSNIANKFIRAGFDYGDQSWRKVSAVRSTNDFKQVTTYGLVGDYDFKELAKDGRITHAVPGELEYTNKVTMSGRMLTLTYVDIVNDDLNALGQKGTKLGGGAIRAWNKKFWKKWNTLAGYNDSAANYTAGAGTAFSSTALDAAVKLFRAQKIPLDGSTNSTDPLGIRPKLLVVPSVWELAAIRLMSSQYLGDGSDDAGTTNPWSGKYEVVAPDYMEEASLGGVDTQSLSGKWGVPEVVVWVRLPSTR